MNINPTYLAVGAAAAIGLVGVYVLASPAGPHDVDWGSGVSSDTAKKYGYGTDPNKDAAHSYVCEDNSDLHDPNTSVIEKGYKMATPLGWAWWIYDSIRRAIECNKLKKEQDDLHLGQQMGAVYAKVATTLAQIDARKNDINGMIQKSQFKMAQATMTDTYSMSVDAHSTIQQGLDLMAEYPDADWQLSDDWNGMLAVTTRQMATLAQLTATLTKGAVDTNSLAATLAPVVADRLSAYNDAYAHYSRGEYDLAESSINQAQSFDTAIAAAIANYNREGIGMPQTDPTPSMKQSIAQLKTEIEDPQQIGSTPTNPRAPVVDQTSDYTGPAADLIHCYDSDYGNLVKTYNAKYTSSVMTLDIMPLVTQYRWVYWGYMDGLKAENDWKNNITATQSAKALPLLTIGIANGKVLPSWVVDPAVRVKNVAGMVDTMSRITQILNK